MRSFFTLVSFLVAAAVPAQTFNSPESVEYDAVNQRWLTGNNGSNDIVSYYPQSSSTSPFAPVNAGPNGIEILGNVAYVCDGGSVLGFDLITGLEVFNLNLGGSFLNGLTTDGLSNLFATDFSAKRIYRIVPATNSFNLMATTVKTPNGIYYDGANNRCVFVTWGSNAPIQAMSLLDSTISTLTSTTLSNCDGITRDLAGNWYVTAWSNNALNRFDPTFSTAPVAVMTGLSGPADIDINYAGDSIAIPNSSSANNVVFYVVPPTGINEAPAAGISIFPSPASTVLNISVPAEYASGQVRIVDLAGRLVMSTPFAGNSVSVNVEPLPEGAYFVEVYSGAALLTRKKVLIAGQ